MLRPRTAVCTLPLYHPPLAGRNGLRMDFNENTVGCSPRVLERLRSLSADELVKYPEREPVEQAIAKFLGVVPGEVLLTNGVDEAIHLLCETYLQSGDEVLIVVPTYSMYRIYAIAAGATMVQVSTAADFEFPTEEVKKRISSRTRLIAIANPNNPTGAVVSREDLLSIARSAPEAAVLIDEAYFEFYGQTMLGEHLELPNLFVARTFSKVYGMAGLRLGVLVGNSEQMPLVRRVSSPYNVNAVALACLPEAIADQDYVRRYVEDVLESRCRLEGVLAERGVQFWPSQANFILTKIGASALDAAEFVEVMRARGILVRDRSADHGCEGCVRITVGPREHTDKLLSALGAAFREPRALEGVTQR